MRKYKPGHLFVRFLCHSKYMRIHVPHVLAAVCIDDFFSIDMKLLIRVDGHQNDP